MSQKEKAIGLGMLCASVGLFYLAINLWICGSDTFCQKNNIVEAITVDYETEVDNWSGRNKPNFYINSPGLNVSFPPPVTTSGDSGDSASDGH